MGEFEGKVALVTGSSRGIGFSIAQLLAAEGAVVGVTARSAASAEAAAEKIGANAIAVELDVSNRESVSAAISRMIEKCGKLDILVNNAGITKDGLAMRMKESDWREVLDANLSGAFYCIKDSLRHMIKAKTGVIVNISSVVAQMGNPGQANYSASKGGLEAMTRSLALEYANRGIRVNAVAPGFIETDMTSGFNETEREELARKIPLGSLGKPEDIARAVAFLASDRASYITGHVLNVSGGIFMG